VRQRLRHAQERAAMGVVDLPQDSSDATHLMTFIGALGFWNEGRAAFASYTRCYGSCRAP